MNARKIIYDRFFKPFEGKNQKNIGVELEFPLINLENKDVCKDVCKNLLDLFLKDGFNCEIEGPSKEPLFIVNKAGDVLSFDNSYNNFEFSLNYSSNLLDLKNRFEKYFLKAQTYLNANGHSLVDVGTNPNKKYITQNPVPYKTYKMIDEYLNKFKGAHEFCDFPAYLSSVQTHLDVNLPELPRAYTLFAKLDFARAILFANSPDFEKTGYICYRDFLWEKSGFSKCPNITGKVDEEFNSVDDLVDCFLKKGMFNRIRNDKYETFKPVNIAEYFENPLYNAKESDISCYLSFKNVEITSRGTLEVRGDCAQPFEDAFAPPAFNLGILENADEAYGCILGFIDENNIKLSNTELRNIVVEGKPLKKIADEDFLADFLYDLVEISYEGLLKRGNGEEVLVEPLFNRAATLFSPANRFYKKESEFATLKKV